MKVLLMHRDRDFPREVEPPSNAQELSEDLELDTLLTAMAAGDRFLYEVSNAGLLSGVKDVDSVLYRQAVLADCLAHPDIARAIYAIALEALDAKRSVFLGYLRSSPEIVLSGAIRVLELLAVALRRLRQIGEEHGGEFASDGFDRFFAMLEEELDDDYFAEIERHLERLRFPDGVLLSAQLGAGNRGADYVLRRARQVKQSWLKRLMAARERSPYSFELAERDEAGSRAVSELKQRGINGVANALAQSADHVIGFFGVLRREMGFYVACLNLHDALAAKREPISFPTPAAENEHTLAARGLYDPCLSLRIDERVVGNALAANGRTLVMITGANQGGKSTFLRSVGVAQLMAQCGMFVAADEMTVSLCNGMFTHFKREEDATMRKGKLEEELSRMSSIADRIAPGCMLLCNESFASTNEREGSEIARQIVRALLERSIRVLYVTHLFTLADGFARDVRDDTLLLRAERGPEGRRTFKIVSGEPEPTSYGKDVYDRVFGWTPTLSARLG